MGSKKKSVPVVDDSLDYIKMIKRVEKNPLLFSSPVASYVQKKKEHVCNKLDRRYKGTKNRRSKLSRQISKIRDSSDHCYHPSYQDQYTSRYPSDKSGYSYTPSSSLVESLQERDIVPAHLDKKGPCSVRYLDIVNQSFVDNLSAECLMDTLESFGLYPQPDGDLPHPNDFDELTCNNIVEEYQARYNEFLTFRSRSPTSK